jgi:hypothetical protein
MTILNNQISFSFTKSMNRKAEQAQSGGLVAVGGEELCKGYRRMNMVQILCTHAWKYKNVS